MLVLLHAAGGPLDGQPVVVRQRDLVAVGASSVEVWRAVLDQLP